MEVNT